MHTPIILATTHSLVSPQPPAGGSGDGDQTQISLKKGRRAPKISRNQGCVSRARFETWLSAKSQGLCYNKRLRNDKFSDDGLRKRGFKRSPLFLHLN